MNDPVADTARAILDGHVVLSRELASAGHYPAVEVLGSVSRLAGELLSPVEMQAATELRGHLATWREARDLVAIGAYVRGSDPTIDRALELLPGITAFLRQGRDESSARAESARRLLELVAPVEARA